ncbi:flagellar basal body L-ring protein FlgH [Edaphobacter sp.]|uniref:flagellar basal body L-ring protein FlgH n=1 Tax=Edaphobacter sp. TaxID=1934404 RepID=UPI002DBF8F89|nr:flagellar basal body L-ring protein FlgH [Edaphobacter sp.]HEU5341412.1 flagellar basal body L-ring protein FlgH [Edaphobacter sp.]
MMESINLEPGTWAADNETRGFVRPIGYARLECEGVGRFALWVVLTLLLLLAATSMRAAPFRKNKKELSVKPNVASESLAAYLARVRAESSNVQATPGSIWTDTGRLTRMSTDVRAMRPHDLISVVVMENLAASRDGTVKNSRSSSANSQVASLLGNLHAGNALQNLVNQTSSSALNAQGATETNSSLSTVFGGQVVDVLPNGMLVIEAARQVEFSQQTETIVLRGLVRPEDISQQNQVSSTAISSLELEVRGKGIISDYTRRPNVLIRLLQQLLIF